MLIFIVSEIRSAASYRILLLNYVSSLPHESLPLLLIEPLPIIVYVTMPPLSL